MAEKDTLILSDRSIIPTDEYVFSLLGEKKIYWQQIVKFATENYKDVSGSWNYYNDGKQWLYKFVRKKNTIFWAALLSGTFRVTFYFGDKAEPMIMSGDLPVKVKEDFKSAKRYGAIRAITTLIVDQTEVDIILKLIDMKSKLK